MPDRSKLILPERNRDEERVIRYLQGRGIHQQVIGYCLENRLLYESSGYHNAVFLGYDEAGEPRYAAIRATYREKYGFPLQYAPQFFALCPRFELPGWSRRFHKEDLFLMALHLQPDIRMGL